MEVEFLYSEAVVRETRQALKWLISLADWRQGPVSIVSAGSDPGVIKVNPGNLPG